MATFFQVNKLDFNTLFPTKKSFLSISTKSLVLLTALGAFSYEIKPQKTAFSDWRYQ